MQHRGKRKLCAMCMHSEIENARIISLEEKNATHAKKRKQISTNYKLKKNIPNFDKFIPMDLV